MAEYLLLEAAFDLAILDLGLPLVDGLTVLKRVRAAKPALPVLVLTALDSLERPRGGPERRRRRLPDQALRLPRARGAPACPAAPQPAVAGGRCRAWAASASTATPAAPHRRRDAGAEPARMDAARPAADAARQRRHQGRRSRRPGPDRTESSGTNSIEVYIHRLRRKLEGSGLAIRTVRGLGYLLEADGPSV